MVHEQIEYQVQQQMVHMEREEVVVVEVLLLQLDLEKVLYV
jgi:hypothetical protein